MSDPRIHRYYYARSLCGTRASTERLTREPKVVTCQRCLRTMREIEEAGR